MSDIAWAIVGAALVLAVGIHAAVRIAIESQRIEAARRIRDEQRAERESGLLPKFEEVREEMRTAKTQMNTFLANNRRA